MAPSSSQPLNSQSQPLLGFGLPTSEPQLHDLLMILKSNILLSLNCAKIGSIASYNTANKTASINIMGVQVLIDGTTLAYPQLSDVPVITFQGGGSALQFPIAVGDQCLVLFSDRNIDNWYVTGTAQPPADGRLHALSDGIAIVGLNSQSNKTIPAPSATETRLLESDRAGNITAKVGLSNGKITVQNTSKNLGTILSSLVTQINNLITALDTLNTTGTATAQTVNAAWVSANLPPITTALTTISSDLTALLY